MANVLLNQRVTATRSESTNHEPSPIDVAAAMSELAKFGWESIVSDQSPNWDKFKQLACVTAFMKQASILQSQVEEEVSKATNKLEVQGSKFGHFLRGLVNNYNHFHAGMFCGFRVIPKS